MKICVTSQGPDLGSPVDPRFGRAAYFVMVDSESMEFEAVRNEVGSGGAGIKAAQVVGNLGAGAVITGSVGPNAFQTLSAAGIEAYVGASGTVKDAVEAYKAGKLGSASSPTASAHAGMR